MHACVIACMRACMCACIIACVRAGVVHAFDEPNIGYAKSTKKKKKKKKKIAAQSRIVTHNQCIHKQVLLAGYPASLWVPMIR